MPSPVRVALLATSVRFGGIERVLLNLLQHMDGGIELVPVVFTRTDIKETSFFDRLETMGVPCETLYVNNIRPVYIVNPIVNLAQVISFLKKSRFDLIHSHGYRADVFALAASRWVRLPIVSTCHGFIGNDRHLRFYNLIDAMVLRFFNRVMAVSARMKEDLVADGLDPARVEVVTNAVTGVTASEQEAVRRQVRTSLGISDCDFVVGYVGRLSAEKGVEYLIRGLGTLTERHRRCRLLVVGDGPQRSELEGLAQELGLAGRVDWVGFQTDTTPWFAAMDAFALPSLTEGTPMALLEAMAHGLPAIATAVGGVPAVVTDRENGLLVPAGDPAALASAIGEVMQGPLKERLSANGIQLVQSTYGMHTWIRNVRDVYLRTLNSRPA